MTNSTSFPQCLTFYQFGLSRNCAKTVCNLIPNLIWAEFSPKRLQTTVFVVLWLRSFYASLLTKLTARGSGFLAGSRSWAHHDVWVNTECNLTTHLIECSMLKLKGHKLKFSNLAKKWCNFSHKPKTHFFDQSTFWTKQDQSRISNKFCNPNLKNIAFFCLHLFTYFQKQTNCR